MRYILLVIFILVISFSFFFLSKTISVKQSSDLEQLYLSENYSKLKELVQDKIKSDPYNIDLYRYLWRVYFYEGELEYATNVINQMSNLFKNSADVNMGYCFIYYQSDKLMEALHYCKKLVSQNPHALSVHKKIINLYVKHQNLELAIDYVNSVSNKLNDLEKIILLAETYDISNEIDKGIRLLEKTRFKYPHASIVYYLLASSYYRKKKYLKSASLFGEYLDIVKNKNSLFEDKFGYKEDALRKMATSYELEQMYNGAKKVYTDLACLYLKREQNLKATKMMKRSAAMGLIDEKGFVSQEKFVKEFTKIENYVEKKCGKLKH